MNQSVIHNFEHGVQPDDQPDVSISDHLLQSARWDDLKLFLDVADARSFRAAAASARVSVNTVRGRIERLESDIGFRLFQRSRTGLALTHEGERLKPKVLRMRSSASEVKEKRPRYRLTSPGEIRIGASEALGSGWLTPHLLDLQSKFPELTVTLLCDYDVASERSAELDVGILWRRPQNPDLITARLATIHFMAFASADYLRKFGVPAKMDDLLGHRYIEQVAPGVKSSLLDQMVGTERPPGFLPLRTNSSLALFWAVATGAGIAWMPTYAMAVTRKLVPIDLPFPLKFDIFYYLHPDGVDSPPVRETVMWLKQLFDPVKYPFFRSDFVHPRDFRNGAQGRDGNVVQLFEPLIGDVLVAPQV